MYFMYFFQTKFLLKRAKHFFWIFSLNCMLRNLLFSYFLQVLFFFLQFLKKKNAKPCYTNLVLNFEDLAKTTLYLELFFVEKNVTSSHILTCSLLFCFFSILITYINHSRIKSLGMELLKALLHIKESHSFK